MRVTDDLELFTVRLIGLPLQEQVVASAHFDELLREFAFLREDATGVPARLIALRDDLATRFETFTASSNLVRDDAVRRGDATVDLAFTLPLAAADSVRELGELLDEADEFCRTGAHLLTLETPPQAVRFRRWYLGEFVRQAAGEPPTPWPNRLGPGG